MILATGEIIIISKYNIHTYLGWKKEEGSFLLRITDGHTNDFAILYNG